MVKNPSLLGLLYLTGAVLSAYLLIWHGSWAMIAALFGKILENMSPPDQPRAVNLAVPAVIGAFVASAGSCLAIGLLAASIRAFAGKPLPRRNTARIFLILSLF